VALAGEHAHSEVFPTVPESAEEPHALGRRHRLVAGTIEPEAGNGRALEVRHGVEACRLGRRELPVGLGLSRDGERARLVLAGDLAVEVFFVRGSNGRVDERRERDVVGRSGDGKRHDPACLARPEEADARGIDVRPRRERRDSAGRVRGEQVEVVVVARAAHAAGCADAALV
jgi:hypothetical protein